MVVSFLIQVSRQTAIFDFSALKAHALTVTILIAVFFIQFVL
jgi:hypothetical protein